MSAFGDCPLAAYGTLQFPEILRSLLGRLPEAAPGAIIDHEARRLHGVSYPGLIPVPGGAAPAQLLMDLSEEDWAILDAYEDDFYALTPVRVRVEDGSEVDAIAYCVPESMASNHSWTTQWFLVEHLETFLGEIGV